MDLTALRQELATLHTAGETLIKTAADAKRDFTADEKTTSDAQFSRMAEIKSVLDRQAKLAEFAFTAKTDAVELPSAPAGQPDVITVSDRFDATDRTEVAAMIAKVGGRKAYAKAVNDWMRTGNVDQRFATITGSTASGILMPTDVMAPITPIALNVFREALQAYGLEPWKTPSTRNINLPIYTAAAGSTVSGTATSETEQEPALTESINSTIVTYHSGNLWFENRELMAVDFDLLSASVPAMSYSKELALESATITALVADSAITASVATTTVSGFTYANFVSLNRVLPKRYQANKVIVLSKPAYTAAENLVTTTGFPLLNQDAQNQQLKRFNGTPVVYSEYLAAFGANNVVGLVFSWIGCRLRDAGEGDILQRFTQTANRQGQTGADLYGYHNFGYSPLAVAKFVCPAS
jgi:HK97 family phage major capsid protein